LLPTGPGEPEVESVVGHAQEDDGSSKLAMRVAEDRLFAVSSK
jgi:hypothetical protein